jgi:parallel beta-helix repeat protein
MTRDERHQWLGAVTTIVRNRWPAHLLYKGDHIWNVDIGCWQVWNGTLWVSICPGGGGGGREGEPEISVGNVLAGDTPADCDILDPGDGSGIALALSLMPVGGAHVYVRRGPYILIVSINVPANVDFQGSGMGTVIIAPAGQPALIVRGSDARIRGMNAEGIRVVSGHRYVVIEENTIQNSSVDGIELNGDEYCTIKGNHILNNSGHGVHLHGGSNYNSLEHNIERGNTGQGILIGAAADQRNIIIGDRLQGNAAPQVIDNGSFTEKAHFEYH